MPDTALGFLLAGVGLWALLPESPSAWRLRMGQTTGVFMIGLGAVVLVSYFTRQDWGGGFWWFTTLRVNGMGQPAAVCFVLSGVSLVVPRFDERWARISQWSALIAGMVGWSVGTAYSYGVGAFHAGTLGASGAIFEGVGFSVFAVGLLGGQLIRVFLPVVCFVVFGLGGLLVHAARVYSLGLGGSIAVFAVSMGLLLSFVVWLVSLRLNRMDADRLSVADALSASERASREMVEALPQLVWTCAPDGPCDYLSRQWVQYTGVPEAEQLGFGWLNSLHPEDRERTIAHWEATAGQGLLFNIEFRIRRYDGVYRWFKTLAHPLRAADGEILRWFGTNTDIEDVRAAEETQARLAAIVESSPDAIIGQTLKGIVTSWNAAAEKLLGYSASEMLGQSLRRIFPDERYEEEQAFLTRAADGESISEFRSVRIRKDHREIPVVVTLAPVRDAAGRVTGVSKTVRDITKVLRAEAELQRAHEDLEERVRVRTAELSKSNAALTRNAGQLADAQRVARMGSWTLDITSGAVEWSEELFRIVGLEPADGPPNYHTQEGMFTPDSWGRLTAAIGHSVESGEGYELELEVIRPDGERRVAVARASTARDAEGRIARLTGTFQDITELKRAREALEASALRMRLATAAAELGVWEWNVETGELSWDDTMRRLFDWAGEVTYEVWKTSVHPDDRSEAVEQVERALRGEGDFDHVFRVLSASGETRHMHGMAAVHRDARGAPRRMIGINRDVTAEHEAKLRLRASEERLKEFVRHAPAAIAMLDRNLVYLQASERWLTDYKLHDCDIIGRCHYDVFPDLPEEWKAIHRRVLGGAVDRCDEASFPRADGSLEWLQWEVRPWHGSEGEIGGLIIFTQVITERKRMEIELRNQKAELLRSNQELEQFAYVASHDLQEPLRAVTGCTQLLQKRYGSALDADAGELMRHSVEGAKRMESLIHDLLAYSRVGVGALPCMPVSLAEPLGDAITNLRTTLVDSGGTITHDPELPVLMIDRGQIAQLFQNLLSNALKYRVPDRAPKVHVSAVREGDACWKISVADDGIGIEPQHFERIFVIFQRLHNRTEYSGTGIGLAICKKIVERHGGKISIESRPGEGTTFHFTIPAQT